MNEDIFNASIRKFLKTLGVSGQREIEKAVRAALADGRLKGNEKCSATRSTATSNWYDRPVFGVVSRPPRRLP